MFVIGIIASVMLLAGGVLVFLSRPRHGMRQRRVTAIAILAAAAIMATVTLAGEPGIPAIVLALVLGVAGLVYGLAAMISFRRDAERHRDRPHDPLSPLHIDPVVERLSRATNAVMWDWHIDTDLVNYSSNIVDMLGYDESSLRSGLEWWSDRIHPEDREHATRTLLETVESAGDRWEVEYRFKRADGKYMHVLDRGFVLTDDEGKPLRMVGAMDDITKRREAERLAREREAQFESLADNAPDFIARIDRQLRHVYVNRALVEATEKSREHFLGKTNRELELDEQLTAFLDESVTSVLEAAEPCTVEFDYEIKGEVRHLMCRLTPEFDEQGEVQTVLSIVRDVSELKRANDQLAHEKAFIDTAIDSLPGMFYLIDANGRFVQWNKNFERASEYSAEEIAEMHPTELFRGADQDLIRQRIASVFEQGESSAEAKMVSKSGRATPYYFTGRQVVLNGKPHLVGMGIDMSDLKAAEQQLRESEERYRLLFDANPHPMFVFDCDTLILLAVNNAMTDKYGYTRDEMLSMTLNDLHKPADWPRIRAAVGVVKDGIDHAGFWQHVLKDGSVIDVEIIAHAITFMGCDAELVLATDVTERLQAEKALRFSEARFALFMDQNPAAAWIKDEGGRYVYVNRRLCEEYEVASENVIGRTDFDLLRKDVAEQLTANDGTVLSNDCPIETIETINHPDGTDHIWLIVKFPMANPEGGRLVGGFALDVTEQKQAEKALREYAAALKRSNEELEQFAYVASHDLQEPLRMVASYTQLLGKRYRGQLDSEADEFIAYAVDGAERMQSLIDDLLLYSRVGSKGGSPTEVQVEEVIDEAMINLAGKIEEGEAHVDRSPMPTVHADRVQLVQLFQNLLSNALKFRGPEPPKVCIEAVREANEWMFSISDNGVGIDPKYHERIFVIFQRLHGRAEYAGTGIGLAICKRIVERHGGRIWVESSPGEGATFRFTLPVHKEAAQ